MIIRGTVAGVMIFRLDCTGMNTVIMKCLAYLGSDRHEIVIAGCHDVHRCDNFRLGELPDV